MGRKRLSDEERIRHKRALRKKWNLAHRKDNLQHEKLRQKLLSIVGSRCLICGTSENVHFHEIHGEPHDSANLCQTLKRPQDFIPLCYSHHKLVHFLATVQSDKQLECAVILSAHITKTV